MAKCVVFRPKDGRLGQMSVEKSGKAATLSVGGGWNFWNNKRRTGGKQEKGTVDAEL